MKTNVVHKQGSGTTYVTTGLDHVARKSPKKDKEVECFACKKKGHYANKCPDRKQARAIAVESEDDEVVQADSESDNKELTTLATWEASQFHTTYTIHNAVNTCHKLKTNEVLLDNQADISIINPALLQHVRASEKTINVNGVGGPQLKVNQVGHLPDFFEVYSSQDTKANVLSFAEVEDLYPITYVRGVSFTVHLEHRDIEFRRREKLYIAVFDDQDEEEDALVNATVQETEALYSKAELVRAKVAHAMMKNTGYPSMEELIRLIEDGNIMEMPGISRADVKRAYEVYGMPPEYVRGKLTKRKVSRVRFDETLKADDKDQVLFTDVMAIDTKHFLVSVCEPLQLTLQTPVISESVDDLGMALQSQLAVLRERGYKPTVVHVDPQSSFQALRTQFPGVVLDVGGARDFVAKVDAKIRRIKEAYRCIKAGLPWKFPVSRVKDLVAYVVSRLNLRRTAALQGTLSPRVLFTGNKPNYKKELSLAFGDYVEVHNGTANTSKERSLPCLALYPVGNSTGTWLFWSISTRQYIRRSSWIKMVTTELVTSAVNTIAEEEEPILPEPIEEPTAEAEGKPDNQAEADAQEDPEMPDLMSGEDDESDDEEEDEDEPPALRRSARQAAGVKAPEKLTLVTKISESDWKEKAKAEAITAELHQLFTELKALMPVMLEEVPKGTKVLRSLMFVVETFLVDGTYDKTKARIVADGRDQDSSLYPDKSSPTVAIHSLLAVLAMYSGKKGYIMGKVDIKGAFIQTPMVGEPVYMRISKKVAKYVIQLYPELIAFVQHDGSITTKLLKAMYGCVQASRLWFDLLTKVLCSRGYRASETDPCVMRKVVDDLIFVVLIYVDDLLIFATKEEMEGLRALLIAEFKSITMQVEQNLSYLGMQLKWNGDNMFVSMDFYLEQVLTGFELIKKRSNPGGKDTFAIDASSVVLPENERKTFHSVVAKLLYLAKRVRPDILVVISFLCTRVTRATQQDMQKLSRLLGYLSNTRKQKLTINANNNLQVRA